MKLLIFLMTISICFMSPFNVFARDISCTVSTKSGIPALKPSQEVLLEQSIINEISSVDCKTNMQLKSVVVVNSVESDCKQLPLTNDRYKCSSILVVKVESSLFDSKSKAFIEKVSSSAGGEWDERVVGNTPSPSRELYKDVFQKNRQEDEKQG